MKIVSCIIFWKFVDVCLLHLSLFPSGSGLCMEWSRVQFHFFFHMGIQLSQHYLLKKSFSTLCSTSFVINYVALSMCLFLGVYSFQNYFDGMCKQKLWRPLYDTVWALSSYLTSLSSLLSWENKMGSVKQLEAQTW